MDKWYYSWKGEKLGPVPLEEMQRLIEEGTLEAGDLVWTSGMSEWQPAGTVQALDFPDEPPPLPDSQAIHQVMDGRFDEAFGAGLRWLWKRKPLFFLAASAICGIAAGGMAAADLDGPYLVAMAIPAGVFFVAFLISGLYSLCCLASVWQRRTWLQQKWECTHKEGGWIKFAEDGGFVRSDGFGAKFTFHHDDDRIELRPVDGSEPIQIQVVLLTDKELALTWDGTTWHYQKPSWWKRVFG